MSKACAAVKFFMGYNFHHFNAVQVRAMCQHAEIAGFAKDLHMLEESKYATTFYNFDASTMECHTEFDMNMTTIFVPKQDWNGKNKNHLQFLFHLTGNDDGILSIPMFPGHILYYHGFLLTHQQMHNNRKCSEFGCCLNYNIGKSSIYQRTISTVLKPTVPYVGSTSTTAIDHGGFSNDRKAESTHQPTTNTLQATPNELYISVLQTVNKQENHIENPAYHKNQYHSLRHNSHPTSHDRQTINHDPTHATTTQANLIYKTTKIDKNDKRIF